MKKIILIGLIFSLLLISGCNNSFQSCITYCKKINQKDFNYEGEGYSSLLDLFNDTLTTMNLTDYDGLIEYCYNECK